MRSSFAPTARQSEEPVARLVNEFRPYLGEERLNIGCAKNLEPGFINLDKNPETGAEIICDLSDASIPCDTGRFDCILASHIFEHLDQDVMFPLMAELHRILKPGGFLIAITPHGASDDAWHNPHHRQLFDQMTWFYYTKGLYEMEGNAGFGADEGRVYADWKVETINLVPYPKFADDPDIEFKIAHYRNVIQEVHAVLKAVK